MLTTATIDGEKIHISDYKKVEGKEPVCPLGHRLVAKKGKILVHHFAHYQNVTCDPFRQGMTYWHSQWQKIVEDKNNTEVCLDVNGVITGNSSFRGYGPVSPAPNHPNASNSRQVGVQPMNPPPVAVQHYQPQVAIPDFLLSPAARATQVSAAPTLSTLNSTDRGVMVMGTENHIADIIRPSQHGRHLVVEIQHSSMDEAMIKAREEYYKNMIWLFDLTPRVVNRGKHNRIALVDGKISYLKDKVAYVAAFSAVSRPNPVFNSSFPQSPFSPQAQTAGTLGRTFDQVELQHQAGASTGLASVFNRAAYCLGDECLEPELTQLGGIFVVISTRTKYWYQTTHPTYFDTGYGILRLLQPLEKGFALTLSMTYRDFMKERMPPVSAKALEEAQWFHDIGPLELMKIGTLPKLLDAQEVRISKNRVVIKGLGDELDGVGFERGADDWHAGSYYRSTRANQALGMEGQVDNSTGNDNLLTRYLNGTFLPTRPGSDSPVTTEALFITKLQKFLGSIKLQIEIEKKKTVTNVIVYCDRETYNMKEKFTTLGMKYRKGAGRKESSKKLIRDGHNALASAVVSAVSPSSASSGPEKLNPNKEKSYYRGSMKEIEAKLSSLL